MVPIDQATLSLIPEGSTINSHCVVKYIVGYMLIICLAKHKLKTKKQKKNRRFVLVASTVVDLAVNMETGCV
jgi:hypothetical protein